MTEDVRKIKIDLYQCAMDLIKGKMKEIHRAIDALQESANEETKSSAGDKYETGRAMAQLEIEKNSAQLAEALRQKAVLDSIDPQEVHTKTKLGSVVVTDKGTFFIAISIGMVSIQGKSFAIVSKEAPVGKLLLGCQSKDEFDFNGRQYKVQEVF